MSHTSHLYLYRPTAKSARSASTRRDTICTMTTPAKPFEFDKALKELEEITQWFEQSDTDLDAGLVKFERGMELATQLKAHLAGVENRIEKIKQKFSAAPAAPAAPTNPNIGPEPELPSDSAGQTDLFES